MKKLATLMLAVMALALTGCSTLDMPTAHSRKAAIESVFAQRAKIEKEQFGSLSDARVAGLMAIDVQDCPADFRSAWLDYLVEVHTLHIRAQRVGGIALAMGKPVSDLPSLIKAAATNPELGIYLLTELGKVDDSWAKVERAGMNYGVMPKFDVGDMSHRPSAPQEPTPTVP